MRLRLTCLIFMNVANHLTELCPIVVRAGESGDSSVIMPNAECTLFVHRSAGSSVRIGSMEVFLLQQLPQKLVPALLCFSLLAKGRKADGETVHMDTDETV